MYSRYRMFRKLEETIATCVVQPCSYVKSEAKTRTPTTLDENWKRQRFIIDVLIAFEFSIICHVLFYHIKY